MEEPEEYASQLRKGYRYISTKHEYARDNSTVIEMWGLDFLVETQNLGNESTYTILQASLILFQPTMCR